MKIHDLKKNLLTVGLLSASISAQAVPTLQVGAPGGPGEGTYADYIANSTNPTETDTAFTSGNTIFFAGVFGPNTLKLGGQYIDAVDGTGTRADGDDYSDVDAALGVFDGHDAIVLAAVPDGTELAALATLTVGGVSAFHSSGTLSGLFPNNHDPLKDAIADFLYFDIGNFAKNPMTVPDFDPETGAADGEIKSLSIAGMGNLDWIHFDLMALETNTQGQTSVRTSWSVNPGSHDVTWNNPNNPGPGPGPTIPEPTTLLLLGSGLLGWFGFSKKKSIAS